VAKSTERLRQMEADIARSRAAASTGALGGLRRQARLECGHLMRIGGGERAYTRLYCPSCRQYRAVLSIAAG